MDEIKWRRLILHQGRFLSILFTEQFQKVQKEMYREYFTRITFLHQVVNHMIIMYIEYVYRLDWVFKFLTQLAVYGRRTVHILDDVRSIRYDNCFLLWTVACKEGICCFWIFAFSREYFFFNGRLMRSHRAKLRGSKRKKVIFVAVCVCLGFFQWTSNEIHESYLSRNPLDFIAWTRIRKDE